MNLVHNERIKLTATWVNGLATASIAIGSIAPTIGAVTGSTSVVLAVGIALFWLFAGAVLHYSARAILGGLRDTP